MLGHDGGACRCAGHVYTRGIEPTYLLCHQGAAENRRQPKLIATGYKNTGGFVELLEVGGALGIGTFGYGQGNGVLDPDLGEYFDVTIAGVGLKRTPTPAARLL